VQPMCNLIATGQVRSGDLISVGFDSRANRMTFTKKAENMPAGAMAELAAIGVPMPVAGGAALAAPAEPARTLSTRSSRRG
jgi:hypothetical protein